jgi:hypothetical protein
MRGGNRNEDEDLTPLGMRDVFRVMGSTGNTLATYRLYNCIEIDRAGVIYSARSPRSQARPG